MKTGPFSKLKTGQVLRFNAHGRFSLGVSHIQLELSSRFSWQFSPPVLTENRIRFQPTREKPPNTAKKRHQNPLTHRQNP